jgi:Tetratricopeptide repeat
VAEMRYNEALAIHRELGDRSGIASALGHLGQVTRERGDYKAAAVLHREGLAILRELGDRRGIAFSLEGLAAVDAAMGHPFRAAHLLGAAERLREEAGSPLAPKDRPDFEQRVAAVRAALGEPSAFDRAWKEGRALKLEQAIEFAIEKAVDEP